MSDIDYYSQEYQKNARKSHWYEDITRNLTKCPFCDLKEKYIITENENVVLTVNLFPYIDGHLMIIPRRHIESFDQLSDAEWRGIRPLIGQGIFLLTDELKYKNVNILYREGEASGMSLKHLHIHILPINEEFMKYEKQGFTWRFQEVNFSALEMARRLKGRFKNGKN